GGAVIGVHTRVRGAVVDVDLSGSHDQVVGLLAHDPRGDDGNGPDQAPGRRVLLQGGRGPEVARGRVLRDHVQVVGRGEPVLKRLQADGRSARADVSAKDRGE